MQKKRQKIKYVCLECGTEFEDDQSEYLPICPSCGEVVDATT